MAQIDTGLLLLVVVAVIAVIGLIIALQTTGGRKRLADAALRLAESLIAYAVRWLERNLPSGIEVVDVPTIAGETKRVDTLAKAKLALDWLRYPSA